MRAIRPAIALLLVCAPAVAGERGADLAQALAATRARIEATDLRAGGRLVRVGGDGARTSYKLTIKSHWFPDGLRVLGEATGPSAERTRFLLHMTAAGHTTIEVLGPGAKAAAELPYERWNQPVLGTDFSYEDMAEGQFFWKAQELLAPAKYGARDCLVVKSAPGGEDRSHYESVTSWVDSTIFYPVRVVKTLRGTGQQKEFTYLGLRQTSGVWSASQVEVKVEGKAGSSLLVIESGTEKAKLTRKDFDLAQE